jgi:hypothetical protein
MNMGSSEKENRKLKSMRWDPHFLRVLKAEAKAEGKSMARILEDAFWFYRPNMRKVEDAQRKKRRLAAGKAEQSLSFEDPEFQVTGLAA